MTTAFIPGIFKRSVLYAFLALTPTLCLGQNAPWQLYTINSAGLPVGGASVKICLPQATGIPCNQPANLFGDTTNAHPLTNPVTSDPLGNAVFNALPGVYMVQVSGTGITTYSYFISIPKQGCNQYPGATAGQKINACILALPPNGVADATDITTNSTLDVDVFAGVTSPGTLVLPPNISYTSPARQVIPASWDVRGGGSSTKITFSPPPLWGVSSTYSNGNQILGISVGGHAIIEENRINGCTHGGSQPLWPDNDSPVSDGNCSWVAVDWVNLGFVGVGAHSWYYPSLGTAPVTGVSLHDLTLDFGNSTNWNGVVPRNVSNSNFFNLWIQNADGSQSSGFDLRDAVGNTVRDSYFTNAAAGSGHLLGGGTNSNLNACQNCGLLEKNDLSHNHVLGVGQTSGDGIDISGINGANADCAGNIVSGNIIDQIPTVGFFNETCDQTSASDNVISNTGGSCVYVNNSNGGSLTGNSKGVSLSGGSCTGAGNQTNSAGVTFVLSSNGKLSGMTIQNVQTYGVLIFDSSGVLVTGCQITSVSQAGSGLYNGVEILSNTASPALHNSVTGNEIVSPDNLMAFGVDFRCAGACIGAFGNTSSVNFITGGNNVSGTFGGQAYTVLTSATNGNGVSVSCTGGGCSVPVNNYTVYDRFGTTGNSYLAPALYHN